MNIVIVESPAKARTIERYLGDDYQVLASYGHVRDLPAKDGSVLPEQDFSMEWDVDERSEKRVREIAKAVKKADALYLATDPDREGEAISWHILDELRRRGALDSTPVKRVAFNAITKTAVQEAFRHPRDLDAHLIEAYLARRALDYLVGFTLSPILWRKLPGSKSAGRVQSVALRLVCEREAEIEAFRPQEYWTVEAQLATEDGATFPARLTHLNAKKLEKFDLPDQVSAERAAETVRRAQALSVAEIERKQVRRQPQPPFTTSTLQQEASRKLGFPATKTMRVAQRLYEGVDLNGEAVGLITYMRTDGVQISNEAIDACRRHIQEQFGSDYLPDKPRAYTSKARNAQEAHEAIRPTEPGRRPQDVGRALEPDERRLYELIWTRTLASQMENARLEQVRADVAANGSGAKPAAQLRATGSTVVFDGFYALYREGKDETEEGEEERRLPPLGERQPLERKSVTPEQHFTQPPPRYSEATLVRKLEELGIGRPSTYAQILQVLQDRDYVRLEKRRFVPEDRGRLVTAFLTSFFERYVQYNFTANLEDQLDQISDGREDWKAVLRRFWESFSNAVEDTKGLSISDVIEALDAELGPHFFPPDPENPDRDPRACPACKDGRLGLKIGRTGGFIGCSNYPECRYTRPLAAPQGDRAEAADQGPRELGSHPETGEAVSLRTGPYGAYVQLGEGADKQKPKRVSLPPTLSPEQVDLERAVKLLALPREVGRHPEDGEPVLVGIGRYGPYVRHGGRYVSLPRGEDVLSVGMNRAMDLLSKAPEKRRGQQVQLGEHPRDGKTVTAGVGRFGPYVRHGKTFASLPKDTSPDQATLEQAVELLDAQAGKQKAKGGGANKRGTGGRTAKKGKAAKTDGAAKGKTPARRRGGKTAAADTTTSS